MVAAGKAGGQLDLLGTAEGAEIGRRADLSRLRSSRPRRHRLAQPPADRAQGKAREAARRTAGRLAGSLQPARSRPWRHGLQAHLRGGRGRDRLQARRRALSAAPEQELAEGQVHEAPGIRHRRLLAFRQGRTGPSPRCCSAPMRTAGSSIAAASAPASTGRPWTTSPGASPGWRRKTMPFDDVPRERARDARWLTPKLVAEVDFTEFTDDGHVRHGAFLGLREDKEAEAVTLETKRTFGKRGRADARGVAGRRACRRTDGGDDRCSAFASPIRGGSSSPTRASPRSTSPATTPSSPTACCDMPPIIPCRWCAARRGPAGPASSRSTRATAFRSRSGKSRSRRNPAAAKTISMSTTPPGWWRRCRWARSNSTSGDRRSTISRSRTA